MAPVHLTLCMQAICREYDNDDFLKKWGLSKASGNALKKYQYGKFKEMFEEFCQFKDLLRKFME